MKNILEKNKKGQVGIIAAIIVGLLAVAGVIYFSTKQTAFEEEQTQLGLTDCETAPTITVATVNAINRGTAVSETAQAIVDGTYIGSIAQGSTTFQKGEKVELLLNASNFIDTTLPAFEVGCGENRLQAEMYATSTNTFRAFNTDGNPLTDAGTACTTNQTASAAPINIDLRIDSTSDESTGNLVIVIESDNSTEVDDLVLSGFPGTKKLSEIPSFYTVQGTDSVVRAYEISEVLDGASVSGNLQITPETGKTMGTGANAVWITAYSKQAFVDTDGKFKIGIENADGTTKYEDTWDFDFCIGNVN